MERTKGADRPAGGGADERQRLLHVLAAATFLIFFQAFMIAPLIPALARIFSTRPTVVGIAVPAYLIPYGAMTLLWGPLSDRLGRRVIILESMTAFVVLTAATAAMDSVGTFTATRAITAVGASGVVPIALALLGDLFEAAFTGRDRPSRRAACSATSTSSRVWGPASRNSVARANRRAVRGSPLRWSGCPSPGMRP